MVQRLQRFATYGHLKQLVLRIIADDMAQHPTTQKEALVGAGGCRGRGGWAGLGCGERALRCRAAVRGSLACAAGLLSAARWPARVRVQARAPAPPAAAVRGGRRPLLDPPRAPQELIAGLTALFEELDVNASGSVSMDELVSGLDKLGYDIRLEGAPPLCWS